MPTLTFAPERTTGRAALSSGATVVEGVVVGVVVDVEAGTTGADTVVGAAAGVTATTAGAVAPGVPAASATGSRAAGAQPDADQDDGCHRRQVAAVDVSHDAVAWRRRRTSARRRRATMVPRTIAATLSTATSGHGFDAGAGGAMPPYPVCTPPVGMTGAAALSDQRHHVELAVGAVDDDHRRLVAGGDRPPGDVQQHVRRACGAHVDVVRAGIDRQVVRGVRVGDRRRRSSDRRRRRCPPAAGRARRG